MVGLREPYLPQHGGRNSHSPKLPPHTSIPTVSGFEGFRKVISEVASKEAPAHRRSFLTDFFP